MPRHYQVNARMSNPHTPNTRPGGPSADRRNFAGFFAATMVTVASLSFWALCGADPAAANAKHEAVIAHAGPVAVAVAVAAPAGSDVAEVPAVVLAQTVMRTRADKVALARVVLKAVGIIP